MLLQPVACRNLLSLSLPVAQSWLVALSPEGDTCCTSHCQLFHPLHFRPPSPPSRRRVMGLLFPRVFLPEYCHITSFFSSFFSSCNSFLSDEFKCLLAGMLPYNLYLSSFFLAVFCAPTMSVSFCRNAAVKPFVFFLAVLSPSWSLSVFLPICCIKRFFPRS